MEITIFFLYTKWLIVLNSNGNKTERSDQKTAVVKFIYSEKATNFCQISTVDLFYVVTDKITVEIFKNFVAFSEYMNFTANCTT